jgi:hypothetical protein
MRVVRMRGAGRLFVEHDGGAGALLQRECGGNKKFVYGILSASPVDRSWSNGSGPGRAIPPSGFRILNYILLNMTNAVTYDHRLQRTRDPVRSPIYKL